MKLSVFYALAAVATGSDKKETCLDRMNTKPFESKTGKLGYFINTARRIIHHKMDAPETQCKLLKRYRTKYFKLTKLRRDCMVKKGKHDARSNGKAERAEKQAARAEKNRERREDDDEGVEEDESLNEVLNQDGISQMDNIVKELNSAVTVEQLQSYCSNNAELSAEEKDDCAKLVSKNNKKTKANAEINFRLAELSKGIQSWIDAFIATNGVCGDRSKNNKKQINNLKKRTISLRKKNPANHKTIQFELKE